MLGVGGEQLQVNALRPLITNQQLREIVAGWCSASHQRRSGTGSMHGRDTSEAERAAAATTREGCESVFGEPPKREWHKERAKQTQANVSDIPKAETTRSDDDGDWFRKLYHADTKAIAGTRP